MKTKVCRRCKQEKPIEDFGYNKHFETNGAKDGRNIYDKECVRTHEAARRARLKAEYPQRKEMIAAQALAEKTQSLTEKVLSAVAAGFRTREAIKRSTKLNPDEVCDALAILWDEGQVKINRERREFHPVTTKRDSVAA